jgi:hypothetical protein
MIEQIHGQDLKLFHPVPEGFPGNPKLLSQIWGGKLQTCVPGIKVCILAEDEASFP